ncbi:iron-sulfur cluster assembly scaffold protein [Anaerofustis sp.]|uniref:iron-sulfur cluster assembly scaffold protein n=1 Tax=Anaerofustis sp. TaxID=1872517 RepID=UPI0025C56E3B|nr:iron-sulfur cluster assembly scaffold protein [Anaerofustis sp.]
MYNDIVLDHFQNPRNVGVIEDATVVAKEASPSCGDTTEFFLKIDDNDVITDIKFRTFGCAAAIASASMSTELIKGKTVKEAREITNKMVVESLGGLPSAKVHCSVLAEGVINKALDDYEEMKKNK